MHSGCVILHLTRPSLAQETPQGFKLSKDRTFFCLVSSSTEDDEADILRVCYCCLEEEEKFALLFQGLNLCFWTGNRPNPFSSFLVTALLVFFGVFLFVFKGEMSMEFKPKE